MNQPKQPIATREEFEQAKKRLDELQQKPPQAGTDQERELRELRERVETYRRDNPDTGTPEGTPEGTPPQGTPRR